MVKNKNIGKRRKSVTITKHDVMFQNIVGTVPQWYTSPATNNEHIISIKNDQYFFNSFINLTPYLRSIYDTIKKNVDVWSSRMPENPTPSDINQMREKIALEWLNKHEDKIDWTSVLAYIDRLKHRTHENEPISLNLVISDGRGGDIITKRSIQDTIDLLGSSLHTYIKVNRSMEFKGYESSMWREISDESDYKYHPEFIHPIYNEIESGEYSVHLTRRGDIIILNSKGILASKRKNRWFIYDVNTLKNNIKESIDETVGVIEKRKGNYRVACNMFETMLDLSYKRSGALLVYDPKNSVIKNIVNKNSIVERGKAKGAHKMLINSVGRIGTTSWKRNKRQKRKLLELSSLDGAVVFNENRVTAFGAMIDTAQDTGNHAGARTTAAYSAYEYGGYPIKVSSDGDVTIIFQSPSQRGSPKRAKINFM